MTMRNEIKQYIEQKLNEKIETVKSIGGGCISDSSIIQLSSGEKLFIKVNDQIPSDMFIKEANGLNEIRKSNSIRVPEILLAETNFILME